MNWKTLEKDDAELNRILQGPMRNYIREARWYGGKASSDKTFYIDHLLPLDSGKDRYYLLILEILYSEGFVHNYFIPLARVAASKVEDERGKICELNNGSHVLCDAVFVSGFRKTIFQLLQNGKKLPLPDSHLDIKRGRVLKQLEAKTKISSRVLDVEQSNTTLVFNDQFYLKLYRRLSRDSNPDIEMAHYLSEKSHFPNIPAFAGSIDWCRPGLYDVSLGLMQAKVENQGDAWNWYNDRLQEVFDRVKKKRIQPDQLPTVRMFDSMRVKEVPAEVADLLGEDLLKATKTLALRTAEMHVGVSAEKLDKRFTRSSYNGDYSVWLKNRIIYQFEARYALLDKTLGKLRGLSREYAESFIENKSHIKNRIYAFDHTELTGQRVRIHGDYHLGQVLVSDDDFYILDFEGEPEATVHDRKVKQSPLKDVAGLFRSFHYAVYSKIFERNLQRPTRQRFFAIGEIFYAYLVGVFLNYYLNRISSGNLNIGYRKEVEQLLDYHLLEKAIYELGYELNSRPTWAIIPLRGIYRIMNQPEA